jgi:uncharacterized protein
MRNIEVRDSRIAGLGVFAIGEFKKEELILEIDDSTVITDPSKLTKHDHEFELDYLENRKIIRMKTPERYINHSCDPNSFVKTIQGTRNVLAMREIRRREEITYDYSINGYDEGTFECRCGSKNCRKIFQGNFFKLPRQIQIKYLPYVENWFRSEHAKDFESLLKSLRPSKNP